MDGPAVVTTPEATVASGPLMPGMAADSSGGLRVLWALRRNGLAAFPARCLEEPVVRLRIPGRALAAGRRDRAGK